LTLLIFFIVATKGNYVLHLASSNHIYTSLVSFSFQIVKQILRKFPEVSGD